MSVSTASSTAIDSVRAGFEAFASGDPARFAAMFTPDATWNHRNDDRFQGVHRGVADIMSFLGESAELTAGTLRAEPLVMTADADCHVSVVVRLSATRPDGRSIVDQQILYFVLDQDLVKSVDQYIGDPAGIRAFWA